MDGYFRVWHGTNCAIDEALRKGGIEIAFPQCDLHIRSVSPEAFARAPKFPQDGIASGNDPRVNPE